MAESTNRPRSFWNYSAMTDIWLTGIALVEALGLVTSGGLLLLQRRRINFLQQQIDGRRMRPKGLFATGRGAVQKMLTTANIMLEQGIGAALRNSIEDLAGWAQVEQPNLARLASRDGTITIFFSDIEGSTEMNERLGDKNFMKVLDRHNRLIHECVKKHKGHVIKTQGDGFMVAFAWPEQGVRCAVDIQRGLQSSIGPAFRQPLLVRIGIHAGPAVRKGDDLFGVNVATAARVAAQASGGEIVVSETVRDAIERFPDLPVGPGREVELKGLQGLREIFPVLWRH